MRLSASVRHSPGGLIERHLQSGVLAAVVDDYVSFERGIYAILTARGRGHPLAQQFMACLGHCSV